MIRKHEALRFLNILQTPDEQTVGMGLQRDGRTDNRTDERRDGWTTPYIDIRIHAQKLHVDKERGIERGEKDEKTEKERKGREVKLGMRRESY